jgi:hypothetical protein
VLTCKLKLRSRTDTPTTCSTVDAIADIEIEEDVVVEKTTRNLKVRPVRSVTKKSTVIEDATVKQKTEVASVKKTKSSKGDDDSDYEEEINDDEDKDGTITLFSAAAFQHQVLNRRREQETEKGKRARRSLNSLSAQQQFELALKRSLTENSK